MRNSVRTWSSLGEQAVGVGDEDPLAAVAVAGRDLDDGTAGGRGRRRRRAAAGRPWWPWRRRRGTPRRRSTGRTSRRVRATTLAPPPPWRAAAAAASAAASSPASDEVGGVGEAGGVARPRPGCRRRGRARTSTCSTLPSSRYADEDRLSSAYTSANSPPPAHRRRQHPLQHRLIDHPCTLPVPPTPPTR